MKKIYDSILESRKLWLFLMLFLVSSAYVWFGKGITFVEWADFQKWLFGIYASANIGEHVATNMATNKEDGK